MSVKMQEGKWYKQRTGQIRGPAERDPGGRDSLYRWTVGGGSGFYTDKGEWINGAMNELDLIEEVESPMVILETLAARPEILTDLQNRLENETAEEWDDDAVGEPVVEMSDDAVGGPVHHPRHYNLHPSGVECIDVIEHLTFNTGTAVKYLWRCGLKSEEKGGGELRDLKKALWYVQREIERITKAVKNEQELRDSLDIKAL